MSRPSAKDAGPITRKQQVAALRTMKAQEVAEHVASHIREAVKQEVEKQVGVLKSTMLDLIDRVMNLETDDIPPPCDFTRYTCNKCGYIGDTSEHENCRYSAAAVPILRVINEGDSPDRPKGTEAPAVPEDDEVVPDPVIEGEADSGDDPKEDDAGR